jgi:hypothetical protein
MLAMNKKQSNSDTLISSAKLRMKDFRRAEVRKNKALLFSSIFRRILIV